ncbi:MAG TPA: EAL domain-containing protein [Xanthobacteraceae bacterium]|nr:EAL domain-containing protein [Xanthobacteraceae bacterium]
MVRISAFVIAACMMLIAGAAGFVVYVRFGFTGAESALVALGTLTGLAVYNTIAARKHDRVETSHQLANLARGSGDLAHQLAEFSRRLNTMEAKVDTVVDRALATTQPLAAEIEELSTMVRQIAGSAAAHETAQPNSDAARNGIGDDHPVIAVAETPSNAPGLARLPLTPMPAARAMPADRKVTPFAGLGRESIIATIRGAIDAGNVELYLRPVVTLPQRKLRFYEAVARLKADNGDVIAAGDFLPYAEAGLLVPKLDNFAVSRCVQIVRRLLLKNRDIGLFCNLTAATLADAGFAKLLEMMDANRAIAAALVFEFRQSAVRAMGPIEHASLATLAERGFRFSMDNLTDLRVNARELNERGFRFIKAPARLFFNRLGAASSDVRPAEFSDVLGRFGIDLIADHIENENTVVDLLDYDVRFGQGILFSPPRPRREDAIGATNAKDDEKTAEKAAEKVVQDDASYDVPLPQGAAHAAATEPAAELIPLARAIVRHG